MYTSWKKCVVKIPHPSHMDLQLRVKPWNEENMEQKNANEPLELVGLDPIRPKITIRIGI